VQRCIAIAPVALRLAFPVLLLGLLALLGGCNEGAHAAGEVESRVQQKAREVQSRFPAWVESGGDGTRVGPLGQELDQHIKAKRFEQAESVLDRLLSILDEPPGATSAPGGGSVQQRIERKSREVRSRFPQWASEGGDEPTFRALKEELDVHMGARRFEEAENVLDRMLTLMGGNGSAEREASTSRAAVAQTAAFDGETIGPEREVRLGAVPDEAEIIFSRRNRIYVMDADGGHETQITFDGRRHLEHVAMSPDRRYIAANYFADPAQGGLSSRVLLFDLERGTERGLVPDFHMAGNGGVDWDRDGYIYFSGVARQPYERPSRREEFIANYAATEIWKVRYDGNGLTRLTATSDRGEADVSVSEDGTLVTYMATYLDPPNDYTEIWVGNSDGSDHRRVYVGGKNKVTSVHDPEISPDNQYVVFSQVDPNFHNFPDDPNANTAHNLITVPLAGDDQRQLTDPGPISVIPDWKGSRVLYLLLSDREKQPFFGIVVMDEDGSNARRIKGDANIAKWIPPRQLSR